jgi:hypothetical protein
MPWLIQGCCLVKAAGRPVRVSFEGGCGLEFRPWAPDNKNTTINSITYMLFLSHLQTLATIQEFRISSSPASVCAEASEISRGCWPSKPDPMYGLSSSGSVSTRRQADFMLPPAQSPLVALAYRPSHGDRYRGRESWPAQSARRRNAPFWPAEAYSA